LFIAYDFEQLIAILTEINGEENVTATEK